MPRVLLTFLLISFSVFSFQSHAGDLPQPKGPVILSVSGNIKQTNQGDQAVFDREMLLGLSDVIVKTDTPWHSGVRQFRGPSGKALMEALGVEGGSLQVTALNDYTARVPVEDFLEKGLILALDLDGKPMTVRQKGPIFIIYPFVDQPDLRNERIFARSVWQVKAIKVE